MKVIRREDEDSNIYIKSYSKENGDLVLHTANGSNNTRLIDMPENEARVLNLMWEQYDNNKKYIEKLRREASRGVKLCVFSVLMVGALFVGISAFSGFITLGQYANLIVTMAAEVGCLTVVGLFDIIRAGKKLDDISKCSLLKKNEVYLNENFDLENVNHIRGVSSKTRRQLEETAKRNEEIVTKNEDELASEETMIEPYFTINTIDKMSLEDLQKIRDNLKRDDYFAFEYNEQAAKETGKQKVYTNKN